MKNIFLFYCVIFLFLLSCSTNIRENPVLEDGFQQHEVVMDGKRIYFILPHCYTDTFCLNGLLGSYWSCVCIEKHVFYSMENDENFFSIVLLKEDDTTENLVYARIDQYFRHFVIDYPNIVSFTEKKKDKNGNLCYLSMGSCVSPIVWEENLELDEQRLIHSRFDFTVYLKCSDSTFYSKYYLCALRTRDKIRNFSYEEKRKIIESVRIEDVK